MVEVPQWAGGRRRVSGGGHPEGGVDEGSRSWTHRFQQPSHPPALPLGAVAEHMVCLRYVWRELGRCRSPNVACITIRRVGNS